MCDECDHPGCQPPARKDYFFSIRTPQPKTLAERMMAYVVQTEGWLKARSILYWETFRARNKDVELSGSVLRYMYYMQVVRKPAKLLGLDLLRDYDLRSDFYDDE